jgi:hypothetical protein
MDFGCIPPSPFPSLSWGICFVERVVSVPRTAVKDRAAASNSSVSAVKVNRIRTSFFLFFFSFTSTLSSYPQLENNLSTAAQCLSPAAHNNNIPHNLLYLKPLMQPIH